MPGIRPEPPAPEPGFDFEVPVHFHDLGMHLSEEQRWAHLGEVAAETWSGGTGYQRQTVRQLYADLAGAGDRPVHRSAVDAATGRRGRAAGRPRYRWPGWTSTCRPPRSPRCW